MKDKITINQVLEELYSTVPSYEILPSRTISRVNKEFIDYVEPLLDTIKLPISAKVYKITQQYLNEWILRYYRKDLPNYTVSPEQYISETLGFLQHYKFTGIKLDNETVVYIKIK